MNTVNTAFLSPSSAFVTARGDPQPGQLGGGVWARAVVGEVESKSKTTGTVDVSQTKGGFGGGNVPPIPGSGTCAGVLHERYMGYQFGFDLASLNLGGNGANLHFGFTAGYFDSRSKDITEGAEIVKVLPGLFGNPDTVVEQFSPPGSFRADTQVPFLGLYGVFTQGNFFADLQVRQDFYVMKFTDPLNGLANQSQLARGISAGGSAGYKIPLPANWFIEPSAGVLWSHVQVDPISTPGSATFQLLNAGSVKIDDIESLLGRLSLRVGTTIPTQAAVWQPFVTVTIFHEFADDATATSRVAGPDTVLCAACPGGVTPNGFKDQILHTSTSRIGTFTQVGAGTATAFGSGWLGYGRVDYRTGENVEGLSFNTGLRYHW